MNLLSSKIANHVDVQ